MARRVIHQNAYVLHTRPYSESSLLIDVFSRDHGRVSLLGKGVRRVKSKVRGMIRPFQPLSLSWSGKSELQTLTAAESDCAIRVMNRSAWLCGCYMNELLIKLLHKHDPHEQLFDHYGKTLESLADGELPQVVLRLFEKKLLQEIGYGLLLTHEIKRNSPVLQDKTYRYYPDSGPVISDGIDLQSEWVVGGSTLIALENEEFADSSQLTESKQLMRALLNQSLQGRKLKSRSIVEHLRLIK